MKIRKTVSVFWMTLGLMLVFFAAASFHGKGTLTVQAADGWQQDDTGWYYLRNDKKVTGLQTIGEKQYYFKQDGYRATGTVTIKGVMYLFHPDTGMLCTGIKGMARIPDTDTYYYFLSKKDGSIAVSRWVTHNGKKYYAGKKGNILFGTVTINKKKFHFTKDGMLTGYAKSSYNGKYYYASSKGVLKTGRKSIDGKRYYFSPSSGQRKSGWIKIDSQYHYFRKSNGTEATGWIKISGKNYYFNSKGRLVTGMLTVNGQTYYLDPDARGARVDNKWVKISGKRYYFNSKGRLQKGFIKAADGNIYYSNHNGVRLTGWVNTGGHKYYFIKGKGYIKTGWLTKNGKTYYMNASGSSKYYGAAVTGWAKIGTETYYFDSNGVLQKGKWVQDASTKLYYYLGTQTGKVLTGRQKIDGVWYDLGATGGYKMPTTGAYVIKVNRALNCITVYRGNVPVKAFICSTAADRVSTPLGTFKILDKLRWHELDGPSWGQYCSHITYNILFHSVPNRRYNDNHSLNTAAYNKLGQPASAGCIRMRVIDAKWIYDNCPVGTTVIIYDDWNSPGPLGKPTHKTIPLSQNYDPTDPYA